MTIGTGCLLEHWNNNPKDRLVDGWLILQSGKELGFVVEPSVAKVLRESVLNDDYEKTKIRFVNYWEWGVCWVSLCVDSIVSVVECDSKVVLYRGNSYYIIDAEPVRIMKAEDITWNK